MNTFVIITLIIVILLALSHPTPIGANTKAIVKKVEKTAVKGAKKATKAGKKVGKKLAKRSTWQSAYAKLRKNPALGPIISSVTRSNAYKQSANFSKQNIHL